MLFGLFYSPASIIIIIFYANPLFYANPSPLPPLPPHFPIQSLSLYWLDLALLGSAPRSDTIRHSTFETICPLLSQSVIASTLPPVIRNIDPPLYPGNFPPFSAPGARGE